jgi:hypothetical protein
MLSIQNFIAATANPHLLISPEHPVPNPYATITLCTDQHHVRDMDLAFTFDDAGLLPLLGRTSMPLDHLNILDRNPAILGKDA